MKPTGKNFAKSAKRFTITELLKNNPQNLPIMIQVDYSRITAEITKQEERLNQMADFLQKRAAKLASATADIEALLAKHKCVLPTMNNAFSSGYGMGEYGEKASMRITLRATLTEGVKNIELYLKRLKAAWEQGISLKYDIHTSGVYVNGGTVEIHLIVN